MLPKVISFKEDSLVKRKGLKRQSWFHLGILTSKGLQWELWEGGGVHFRVLS